MKNRTDIHGDESVHYQKADNLYRGVAPSNTELNQTHERTVATTKVEGTVSLRYAPRNPKKDEAETC